MDMQSLVLVAAALVLLTLLMLRRRERTSRPTTAKREELDTVTAWPPQSVRVMTVAERESFDLLRRALPGLMVLAQVPLARFVKVPTRHSYGEWLQRVGSLSADLLVCDSGSKVLAVIDVRSSAESERARSRHERMARVLKAAGVKVYTWREDQLPTASQVRALIGAELMKHLPAATPAKQQPVNSRPIPLIPVAEIEEILAEGDKAQRDEGLEPVSSGFFDDMETAPTAAAGGRR